jgi:hypothetical protein
LLLECLQAHQATVLAASIATLMGANSVPLCDPSQNGWEAERPHAHHQYSPGSTFCTMGLFWKTVGSLMPFLLTRQNTRRKAKPRKTKLLLSDGVRPTPFSTFLRRIFFSAIYRNLPQFPSVDFKPVMTGLPPPSHQHAGGGLAQKKASAFRPRPAAHCPLSIIHCQLSIVNYPLSPPPSPSKFQHGANLSSVLSATVSTTAEALAEEAAPPQHNHTTQLWERKQ